MLMKFTRYLLIGVAILIGASTLYVNWGTSQANKQLEQVDAASQAGDAFITQAVPQYLELFGEANLKGYPGNREQYKAKAQDTLDLFGKATAQYRLAGDQLDEACRQPVKKPLSDYWTLKAQGYRKLADSKDAYANLVRLLLDETITDMDTLNVKVEPLINLAQKLNDEFDKLSADAQKFQDAHKDVIQ